LTEQMAKLPAEFEAFFRWFPATALNGMPEVSDFIGRRQGFPQGRRQFWQIFKSMTPGAYILVAGAARRFADRMCAVTLHTIHPRKIFTFREVAAGFKRLQWRLVTGTAPFQNLIRVHLTDEVLRMSRRFIDSRFIAAMAVFAADATPRMSAVGK
jgi:hypothetical protein